MAIQTLYPTINPSLNLDFANTKKLDPRITFTRTTTARYYDGKTVAKAEENLLLRSQDYSATWTVTNLTPVTGKTAPDGTSTATEFTAGAANAVLTQGYTAIAGSYTFSVFLRRVTGTGTIEIAADNGTWTAKTITSDWARYDVTQTVAAGSKTAGVRVVTSGDAIEVWGAQLEQRSAVTAYTPTTTQPITNYVPVLLTAAAGQARFDHNPTTGESLGLLVEEQRANLLTYSAQFDDASWTKTRSSVVSNTIIAPDGTLTGDKLIPNTDSNTHNVSKGASLVASSTNTISVYMKAGEYNWGSITTNNGTTFPTAYFNLATGAAGSVSAGSSSTIQSAGNGWYRCTLTYTMASGTATTVFVLVAEDNNDQSFAGDGYSGIYIWGAQLEAGAFSTSYIPTVAATVTRNADAASMTGTNFSSWYRQGEGTLYWNGSGVDAFGRSMLSISDNTTSNRIRMVWTTSNGRVINTEIFASGTFQGGVPSSVSTITTGQQYKLSFAYNTNDLAGSRDGGAVGTDTSALIPVVDRMFIGAGPTGAFEYFGGHIRKISFYPSRISDAQLQALTTV